MSLPTIEAAGGLRPAIAPSLSAVRRADARADSPLLSPLSVLPVVGDQIDGLRAITDRLDTIADAGDQALRRVEDGLAETGEPGGRVRLVTTAIDAVDAVEDRVLSSADVRDGDLIGPLKGANERLEAELDDLPGRFADLRSQLRVVRELLEGPTRVLLVAGNNAEMRAGMGMHLSAGVITIQDGDFSTSPFVSTGDLTQLTDGRVEVPPELDAIFGGIWGFGREWRTTSTTPDFRTVGSVLAQLAERSPIGEVDLVVSMDVPALALLLDATGPVRVDGEVVSSANAVDLLLRENYLRYGDVSDTDVRRDLQSRIASTIFDTVTERDLDIVELGAALTSAAEGRHLLGWSANPDVQALWESMGADGGLSQTSFLVAAQNASASKRDFYLSPVVSVIPVGDPVDGRRRFRAALTLANPEVSPSAPYIDSLNRFVPKGVHRAYVTFTLPGSARDVEVMTGTPSRTGTDGPTVLAAVWIRVPVEEQRSAVIEFTLPADVRAVELVPGARVRPTPYRFGPVTVWDDVPRTVPLPTTATVSVQGPQFLAAASLLAVFAGLVFVVTRSRRLTDGAADPAGARADAWLAAASFALAVVLAVFASI